MNVVVINGSPKSGKSITYHHLLYLEKHFKQMKFEVIHIEAIIDKLSVDDYVGSLIQQMSSADLVIFSYPVYTLSIPYQLMLLMNALMEHTSRYKLRNTYVTQFSTSNHFFDHTAHDYMVACFESLDFYYLGGHSADTTDLLENQGRVRMIQYFDKIIHKIEWEYHPTKTLCHQFRDPVPFCYVVKAEEEKVQENIVIVYNGLDYSATLKEMIKAFENMCEYRVHLLDLSNHVIKNGCTCCLQCLNSDSCVFNDDFENLYRNVILHADVLIYASDVRHHYIHSDFKRLDDRAFMKDHPVLGENKAVGYLISGPLSHEHNLKKILETRVALARRNLLGFATNEYDTVEAVRILADQVAYFMKNKPCSTENFLGVAGMKMMRDIVFENRGILYKSYHHHKKNPYYRFPKKEYLKQFRNRWLMWFCKISKKEDVALEKMIEQGLDIYRRQIERY
jgi:multimeric flavodoxin WrbA